MECFFRLLCCRLELWRLFTGFLFYVKVWYEWSVTSYNDNWFVTVLFSIWKICSERIIKPSVMQFLRFLQSTVIVFTTLCRFEQTGKCICQNEFIQIAFDIMEIKAIFNVHYIVLFYNGTGWRIEMC